MFDREVVKVASVEVRCDGNLPFKVCECLLNYTTFFRADVNSYIFRKSFEASLGCTVQPGPELFAVTLNNI